jgi:hypothetical protein
MAALSERFRTAARLDFSAGERYAAHSVQDVHGRERQEVGLDQTGVVVC